MTALPAGWRTWPSHVLDALLDKLDDSSGAWDDVLDELREREDEADTRALNGGVLP